MIGILCALDREIEELLNELEGAQHRAIPRISAKRTEFGDDLLLGHRA